jgi:hypothetical protein
MKLTNRFGIPETFVNVLKRPTYSKGAAHLSVTQLINSPKIVALTKKFEAELEQDVADMVWSIFGSAIHNILEHGKDENHLVEERIHSMVDGWKISGAVDLQVVDDQGGISIRDYKTTSVWAVMNEKIEWEQQLNIYAWLVDTVKEDFHVTDLGIVAIIRDWSRRDAARNPDYPQAPVKELPIKLWPYEERKEFVQSRITSHSACEFAMETGEDLPPVRLRRCGRNRLHGRSRRLEGSGLSLSTIQRNPCSRPLKLLVQHTRSKCVRAVALGVSLSAQSIPTVSNGGTTRRAKMETRQDLILKFMLALASNSQIFLDSDQSELTSSQTADIIYCAADALVERFYRSL